MTFAHCNDLKTVSKQKPHVSFGSFSALGVSPKLSLFPFFPMASPISWVTIRGIFSAVTRVKTGLTQKIQRYEHFSPCDEVEEELIALARVRLSISSSPIYWTARIPYFILFRLPGAFIHTPFLLKHFSPFLAPTLF